jgi:hypothetical protein
LSGSVEWQRGANVMKNENVKIKDRALRLWRSKRRKQKGLRRSSGFGKDNL